MHAVIVVANMIFDRNWGLKELSDKDEDVGDKIASAKRMVTHAIDSTAKTSVGQFATQGE